MLSPHRRSGSSRGVTLAKKEESSGTSQRLVRSRSAVLGYAVPFGVGGYTTEAQSCWRGSAPFRCQEPYLRACHSCPGPQCPAPWGTDSERWLLQPGVLVADQEQSVSLYESPLQPEPGRGPSLTCTQTSLSSLADSVSALCRGYWLNLVGSALFTGLLCSL